MTAHSFTDLLARTAEGVFCAQCLLPFSNPGALTEHIKLVHVTSAAVLASVSKLTKRPPSPPDLPTDLSNKKRRTDVGISSVMDLSSTTTLLCNQCNAPFDNFESFRNHLKTHLDGGQGSKSVVCPECKLALPSEVDLETHLASHLLAVSTEYGCQACFKLFTKPDELQKHLMDIHAHHLYRCALCKDMFDSKVSIQVHFAVKHSNECKVQKCTRCSMVFHSTREFEAHVRGVHMRNDTSQSDAGYRCLLCHLTVATEAEFTAHLATHKKQFQCNLCEEAFHVEFLLDKHMQSQHSSEMNGNLSHSSRLRGGEGDGPTFEELRCEFCNTDFSSESSLLNHHHKVHGNKSYSGGVKIAAATVSLLCAYCNEACKSRSDLEAHVKMHQQGSGGGGGRHKCNICDELCPSVGTLAQHKLTHLKALSNCTSCSQCREPLKSSQQISNHQSEHFPGSLPQPCVICRQTLLSKAELKVHAKFHGTQGNSNNSHREIFIAKREMKEVFNNNIEKTNLSDPFKCPLCQIKLETLEEAENHSCPIHRNGSPNAPSNHHNKPEDPRTYQCIKCQESFSTESEIEAHVSLHLRTEGSHHECHLCHDNFDTPLRLQCHLIEHTFEGCGSYTCYLCSAVFTMASRLQHHMHDHGLNSRPYDCHHCHLRFFFKAELENHILTHTEVSSGKCKECADSIQNNGKLSQVVKGKQCVLLAKSGDVIKEDPMNQDSPVNGVNATEADIKTSDNNNHHESGNKKESTVPCGTCSRRCRDETSRRVHELTHEGGRPYLCGSCGASFTRKCEARRHSITKHKLRTQDEDNGDPPTTESPGISKTVHTSSENIVKLEVNDSDFCLLCGSCSCKFSTACELAAHVSEHHATSDTIVVRVNSRCSSCSEEE